MLSTRSIPLPLEPFGIEAIEYQANALGLTPGEFLAGAALYHLGTMSETSSASLPRESPADCRPALTVALEADEWMALEAEAGDAGVTVGELLGHASLRLAADLDSGRVAEWIDSVA
jgi:hypothetical protein